MRILVVEDDPGLSKAVAGGLAEQGHQVSVAGTYDDGLLRVALGSFDVIVLDVMLPGGSGFALCREIRRREIDDGYAPKLIHTYRGAGYRFGVWRCLTAMPITQRGTVASPSRHLTALDGIL